MSGAPGAAGDWGSLGVVLGRLARGDLAAVDDLQAMAGRAGVPPEVAEAAEAVGLLLVKMEGMDFLLSTADEAEARLKTLNELKNRHLGIAAHDLRNPLGTIRGLANLLSRGEMDDDKRRTLSRSIVRISDEMLSLVEKLLDVAVIESGRLELDLARGNLAELCREHGERAASAGSEKRIVLSTRLASVPDTAFDRVRMGQVLDNLLSNALKFSPPASTVELACAVDRAAIVITVRDRGPGMPAEELTGIFDPYGRATARPTAGEKSTGLGLSIARPIVEAHGGTLHVDSAVGEGTTFTLRMPLEGAEGPAAG